MFCKILESCTQKIKGLPRWAGWLFCALAALAGAISLLYLWRVLYDLDLRPEIDQKILLLGLAGVALAGVGAAFGVSRVKDTAAKGALVIFLCGMLFAFVNPPMQAPDEYTHYLRAYSISQGHFDFDGSREYPEDVARLYETFPGAWVNAHTSIGSFEDEETGEETYYSSAGYALKRYEEGGKVYSVLDSFQEYLDGGEAEPVTEPILVMILPLVPQAVGMALARLLGLGALGCLYGGRLVNLLAYTGLCWLALKNTRRARPLFLAFMLCPLSLYLGGSLSYDATLLGCYYLMLSFLDKEEFTRWDAGWFLFALGWANMAKPAINLLWLFVPLVIAGRKWKLKTKFWLFTGAGLAVALGITFFTTWYGNFFRHDYDLSALGRMIEGADQIPQLLFVLRYLPRYLAVMVQTLYENQFFLGQLGLFGALDLDIPLLDLTAPMVLLVAAFLSVPKKENRLEPQRAFGLGGFGLVYLAGAMTAMYITYTPVGMVRIIGLQARYFLPVFLAFYWLAAQALSRYLAPVSRKKETLGLPLFGIYGAVGALLLFQHYYIGPIYTIG